jgi:hypothetical protein
VPSSADSQRGRLDGVAPDYTDTGGVDLRSTAERSGSAGACSWMREALVPVLDELTALQADAIRATAAAHDRDPDALARELMHLLAADKTSEAIDATSAIPALTTDHDDTVRILLPLKGIAVTNAHADEDLHRGRRMRGRWIVDGRRRGAGRRQRRGMGR